MSTVNIGSALPAGSNTIGVVKLVDTAGVNQWGIDVNNNGHVAIYNGANAMGVDANNNAHVGIWNGTNQMAVNSGGNAASNINQVGGASVTLGSKTSANSFPVVIASDQGAVTVSGTVTANAGTGFFNVQGPVASGSSNANNPIKIGGVFNTTQPTVTNGQIVDGQFTARGALIVATGVDGLTIGNNNTGSVVTAEVSPTRRLRIQQDGSQIFYEAWDSGTVDTTYNWNAAVVSGGGSSTPSTGQEILGSGTTASGYAYLTSKVKIQPASPGFLELDHQIQTTYPIPAHTYANWGFGNVPGSPTSSAPLTDSVNFEIGTTGKMAAVCWAGGTRNLIQDLSSSGSNVQPTDGNVHRYQIFMRGDTIYWLIDNTTVASILTGALGPNTNLLTIMIETGVDATGASSQLQITSAAAYVGDSTKSVTHIADPTHPQYAATVKPGSTAAASTDMPIVAALHPSSPLPAGTNSIGKISDITNVETTLSAGTAPANALMTGAIYNSTAPAPSSGQTLANQADQAGNTRMFPGIALTTLSVWNSSTASNATQTIFSNSGCPAVLIQLDQTTTITGGAITIEATFDGTNWVAATANTILDPTSTTYAQIAVPYTLQASTNKPFIVTNNGWQGLRIRLSTVITGTGTVTPYYALLPYDPIDSVLAYSPTAANFQTSIGAVAASLTQANQVPVSNAGQQGQLTITGSLTANSDNSLTFSGNSTVARRIRIQNESTGVIYWALDTTASAGSPSVINPGSNAVSVEWINMACTTLHIFIPSGGTTTLNGSGGVKVTAWA